jgi:hypothetical protein
MLLNRIIAPELFRAFYSMSQLRDLMDQKSVLNTALFERPATIALLDLTVDRRI